jgi:beta-galactosidase
MPALRRTVILLTLSLAFQTSWSQRDTLSLNGPWSFAVDSLNQGIVARWESTGLPRSVTRSVTVPHTWNSMPGLETYAGTGWYERSFTVPSAWAGRKIFLRFAAVYHDAMVWIDGKKVGEHEGSGFTPFRLDVTPFVRAGETSVIRVAASNAYTTRTIPYERSFDWPNDGGILRPVSLVALPPRCIDHLQVSGAPRLSAGKTGGHVNLSFSLAGFEGMADPDIDCQVLIREESSPEGAGILTLEWPLTSLKQVERHSFDVARVLPWDFDHPKLYTLELRISRKGILLDRTRATFGFREIRTEGSRIILNGQPVRLMGVEWMPGSSLTNGMAESEEELEAMLGKLRGVNAVFTRFHWQQDERVFDWCDRHGVLVQEEVPLWGGATPLNDTILALAKTHLDEMIGAHHNHPSIVMWGVGNELSSAEPSILNGVRELYRHAKSLDSSRLVNYVSNRAMFSGGRDAIREGDVLMFNEYQDTWYQGDPARIGGMLDTLHLEYPGKPVVISEYGMCEPAFQGGDERRINDMIYHTAVYESRPYVSGAIYFCLNDYRTHVGEAGEGLLRRRVHGVTDLTGIEKPSAHVLRRMSSPIKLINVPWQGKHLLELKLVGGGGLPSYLCSGYTLYWSAPGTDYRSGLAVRIPDLRANEDTHVFLDEYKGESVIVTLVRPTGEVVDSWKFLVEQPK